jgi:hypothetical protein
MTRRLDDEHELDEHLRRTLRAVALTVQEPSAGDSASSPRSRRRRRLLVGAGVTLVAVPLAAAAVVRLGPEYVDRIPPEDPIISGTLDGERYWVVDGRETPRCEGSPSGIELIVEEHNLVGREWNTTGAFFGRPTADGCAPRIPDDPPEATYDADGGTRIGEGMLWMGALHPDVDQVRLSVGGGESVDADTFRHEGGTYFVLEVPPGTETFRIDYLVDGEVVRPPAGERAEHLMPRD